MEWNEEAVSAAAQALRNVGQAVDTITAKSTQLEGLLVALDQAVLAGDMTAQLTHATLWLACDLVTDIRRAAGRL